MKVESNRYLGLLKNKLLLGTGALALACALGAGWGELESTTYGHRAQGHDNTSQQIKYDLAQARDGQESIGPWLEGAEVFAGILVVEASIALGIEEARRRREEYRLEDIPPLGAE